MTNSCLAFSAFIKFNENTCETVCADRCQPTFLKINLVRMSGFQNAKPLINEWFAWLRFVVKVFVENYSIVKLFIAFTLRAQLRVGGAIACHVRCV